ncbi:cupin domain-containing protein [Nocardia nova]|uniref:cupin domain-containing protein n=1 Tax=Nocardia nova TaxID=37330 RepID=UPI0018932E08|nr:cupin domain-containing protein [Nocardia nova]MBF6149485.1 cupin domain-containing protein [Nocardia nova]
MGSLDNFQSRVVVTGLDADGRSAVLSDSASGTRAPTPVATLNDVWQADGLPTRVLADSTLNGAFDLAPPAAGVKVTVCALPPDDEWKGSAEYEAALAAVGAGSSARGNAEVDGFHETDTVDVITMVSGEIVAVLETAEVVLRQGDTFIQRGTKHAWSNRSDGPAIFVMTMIPAVRGTEAEQS